MDLHPEVAELARRLLRLEEHLAENGAVHWATMISRCRLSIERSDAWGLHGFLAMFGGMGSLNDLVLQQDGNILQAENDRLQVLRGDAWGLADKLKRGEGAGQA